MGAAVALEVVEAAAGNAPTRKERRSIGIRPRRVNAEDTFLINGFTKAVKYYRP
jgi:hypothetical protein